MIGPLTLSAWLRALRRRGVQVRLDGGRVRVSGVRKLGPAERAALSASAEQVRALLEARAKRRRKEEEQQHDMAKPPERPRRVIGHQAMPGYPHLARLLHADEVTDIRPSPRARQLGGLPYGWTKFGGE